MKDLLSSIETEYGFAALDKSGQRIDSRFVHDLFCHTAQWEQPWLPAVEGGWFLGNGARLYWDSGGHPEYAAAECAGHPRHLVAQVRAGHAIVSRIARRMELDPRVDKICAWRGNVDYITGQTWGCHENYLTRLPVGELANDLLPFLVSRTLYGGAGGWNLQNKTQFSLSPRLELFLSRSSSETQSNRGIINTRDECHAKNYHRLHLICRDSVTSQLAELLSIGMTRSVVALTDAKLHPAKGLTLADNVAALHVFCRDTSCRAKVQSNQGRLTAIEIQRHYLEEIARNAANLPRWSQEIAALCSDVLDQLDDYPLQLAGKLDWPTKLSIFNSNKHSDHRHLLLQDVLMSDLHEPLLEEFYKQSNSNIVSANEVESAIADAPKTTRAAVRGDVVKSLSGRQDTYCNWSEIITPTRRLILENPFEKQECWHERT